jgi:hypothetical protein
MAEKKEVDPKIRQIVREIIKEQYPNGFFNMQDLINYLKEEHGDANLSTTPTLKKQTFSQELTERLESLEPKEREANKPPAPKPTRKRTEKEQRIYKALPEHVRAFQDLLDDIGITPQEAIARLEEENKREAAKTPEQKQEEEVLNAMPLKYVVAWYELKKENYKGFGPISTEEEAAFWAVLSSKLRGELKLIVNELKFISRILNDTEILKLSPDEQQLLMFFRKK